MSNAAQKAAPTYLKEARLAAGYANRGTASTEVPYSPEVIGRHERGEVHVAPEDMIVYAKCYNRQDILFRYCAECAVGRATGKLVKERDLPLATLRLTRRLRWAAKEIADDLERIADDGVLNDADRPQFGRSLTALEELSATIADYLLYAAAQGIRKEPPLTGTTPNNQDHYT
jgi:hypothetical protein